MGVLHRVVAAGKLMAFVVVSAAIVGVSSERMFWYWSSDLVEHPIVALVYAPATGGVLWAISRYQAVGVSGLVLVAPLMGYYVEGVITPVVYSGGPVPLFPLWFAAWHGMLSIGLLWYGIRWCLVRGRWLTLALASAGLGAFWGLWSITLTLPENVNDPDLIADHGGPLTVLDPTAFTEYAVVFTLVIVAGHGLLACGLWPTQLNPPRSVRWLWIGVTAIAVIGWTVVIPWAAPMFAVLVALQFWLLRRAGRGWEQPSLLAELAQPIHWPSLTALAPMPVVAAAVYAVLWEMSVPDESVRVIYYGVIAVQVVAMAGALAWAVRVTGRGPKMPSRPHDPRLALHP